MYPPSASRDLYPHTGMNNNTSKVRLAMSLTVLLVALLLCTVLPILCFFAYYFNFSAPLGFVFEKVLIQISLANSNVVAFANYVVRWWNNTGTVRTSFDFKTCREFSTG
jgi:hypothetical protein